MTAYPYVPSYWDRYGTRSVTLGLMLHMAEGSGTVGYLDKIGRIPPRGVSVHFVCETTGRMVRMLGLNAASGSLNPADRSTDKAYYGHSHLVSVLGDWWTNPNEAVISIEIEGFAATGPNGRQTDALVAWAADMVRLYPTIRGALGHADQTNTKGCPGTSAPMRAVFAAIGGHGLWTPEDDMAQTTVTPILPTSTGHVTSAGPVDLYTADGSAHKAGITLADFPCDAVERVITQSDGRAPHGGPGWRLLTARPHAGYYVSSAVVTYAGPPPTSGDAAVNAALDHVLGPAQATVTAISEARPR